MSTEPKRMYWLDVSRVLAILFVSFNHSINCSYAIYANQFAEFCELRRLETLFKSFIYVFSRLGVPLFLMISGALLLSKQINSEKDVYRFYKHNLLGLLITSEIWYFIMFCVVYFYDTKIPWSWNSLQLAVPELINRMLFLENGTFGSLWYIPMILCIYAVIPFFAFVLRNFDLKAFGLPSAIVFISAMLIPNINQTLEMFGSTYKIKCMLNQADVFSMYMLYVFTGYAVYGKLLDDVKTKYLLIWLVCAFVFAVSWQYLGFLKPWDCYINDKYDFVGILVISALLFEVSRRFSDYLLFLKTPVTYLARIAFGIYFVHVIFRFYLQQTIVFKDMCQFEKFWYVEIISMLGSVLVIAPVAKINWCKKYLFMMK